jgi:type IV secretory pathway VirB2 component (pilin)
MSDEDHRWLKTSSRKKGPVTREIIIIIVIIIGDLTWRKGSTLVLAVTVTTKLLLTCN